VRRTGPSDRALAWIESVCLHLMGFGWAAAVLLACAGYEFYGLPLWLLVLAYVPPALSRRRLPVLAVLLVLPGMCLAPLAVPSSAGANVVPFTLLAIAASLLTSTRALTLSRGAGVYALRRERAVGLPLVALAALAQGIIGRPALGPMALCAALYVVGALLGLPLAQARASGDSASGRRLLRSFALSGLIALLSGAIAGLIEVVHLLVRSGTLRPFGAAWQALLAPLGWVVGGLAAGLGRLRPSRAPRVPSHTPLRAGSVPRAPAVLVDAVELAILAGALLSVLLLIYFLYRRQREREPEELPDANASDTSAHVLRGRIPTQRPAADYGLGARRLVRRAVGRHVERRNLPPATTARALAREEGWTGDLLATYEHARYAFAQPLTMTAAQHFLRSFGRLFARRAGRRPPA